MTVYSVTWDDIEEAVSEIFKDVVKSNKAYDGVVGIQRGGLIPAVMLSHKLNLPLHVIKYSSHRGQGSKEYQDELPDWLSKGDWLIVDDIADSGHTLKDIKEVALNSTTVVMVCRATSVYIPDYFGILIRDKRWVEFPYEF